jgi:hypothetical protein
VQQQIAASNTDTEVARRRISLHCAVSDSSTAPTFAVRAYDTIIRPAVPFVPDTFSGPDLIFNASPSRPEILIEIVPSKSACVSM